MGGKANYVCRRQENNGASRLDQHPAGLQGLASDVDCCEATSSAYVAQLRNARLEVIEDSGHATPLDQPEALNRLLDEFIAAHSAALPA